MQDTIGAVKWTMTLLFNDDNGNNYDSCLDSWEDILLGDQVVTIKAMAMSWEPSMQLWYGLVRYVKEPSQSW